MNAEEDEMIFRDDDLQIESTMENGNWEAYLHLKQIAANSYGMKREGKKEGRKDGRSDGKKERREEGRIAERYE